MVLEYVKRIGILVGGLAISGVGIALMLQANIGLEPWSVLQQGMAQTFGITYGMASIIVGITVILIAVFCGESFGIGTIANIAICGPTVDLILWLDLIPKMHSKTGGLVMLLIGMELLAIGTWMYMTSALGSGPRDALMVALAKKTSFSVGMCRSSVELIAILVGWMLGGQVGIGTIVTAVGIGFLFNLTFYFMHFRAAEVHQENLPETLRRIRGKEQAAES